MIVDNIIDAVETAVEGAAVTADSTSVGVGGDNPDAITVAGAPAQFAGLDNGTLEDSGQDRNFVVEVSSVEKVDGTGTTGTTNRRIRLAVRIKFVSEGRGRRAFQSLVFSDACRIQDRVEVALNAISCGGVGVCYSEPGADLSWSYNEATVAYLNVPFVIEYTDDLVTA